MFMSEESLRLKANACKPRSIDNYLEYGLKQVLRTKILVKLLKVSVGAAIPSKIVNYRNAALKKPIQDKKK